MSVLYAWLRRHPVLVDGVLAFVFLVAGMPGAVQQPWPRLPLTLLLVVPVAFRRRNPVLAFSIAVAAGAGQVLSGIRPFGSDLAIVVLVYTLAGLFAGLAGLLQYSRLTMGDPTAAPGLELDVIAAVVIGGGSLAGGEGSVLGSLIGALFMMTIRYGCSQMGWPSYRTEIVAGVIIIIAVALDRWRHRRGW